MDDAIRRMIGALSEGRERYGRAAARQAAVFEGTAPDRPPLLLSAGLGAEWAAIPRYDFIEIHGDSEKMLHNELLSALCARAGGLDAVPSVRANMGCGIVPALFGVKPRLFADMMPWVKDHLPKGAIRELRAGDLSVEGEFGTAMAHMEFMADALAGSGVRVYPVDIQGAFDAAHIVYGDAIFYELYDDPEFVHHLLDLCCEAIRIAFRECLARMPGSEDSVPHYNALCVPRRLGGIKLSEDTSTLLSGAQIGEFVAPYLRRTLAEAGGGYVHYCGKNPYLYEAVLREPLVCGLNFGNPERHDMDRVLADCAARGIAYYGAIPRRPDEDESTYFRRILAASRYEGVSRILPTPHCEAGESERVRGEWERACGEGRG